MRVLDAMLAQIGDLCTSDIAGRVGLSIDRVEAAVAALSIAHVQPGDTVKVASASSAIPEESLMAVLQVLGGQPALATLADLMGYHKGKGSIWESLEDLTGDLGR